MTMRLGICLDLCGAGARRQPHANQADGFLMAGIVRASKSALATRNVNFANCGIEIIDPRNR
jgi:hypothetical protein